jgi:hypothetical protein
MSIVRADLKNFRSQIFNDTPSNGGRMARNPAVEIPSGVVSNLFPDAGEAERTAGSDKFRKTFYSNHESTALTLFNSRLFEELQTPGDDAFYFFLGSQINTQGDLTGSEPRFGAGLLDVDALASATSIDVLMESILPNCFRNGELLRLSDQADIDSAGTEEFVRIHPSTVITNLGSVYTIPLETPLLNSFLAASPTKVASILESGDVLPNFASFVVTSGLSGTYDEVTFPLVLDNEGTVFQNWTLTFTSATNYGVVGDLIGSVSSGNISSDFSPTNADFGVPFFTLLSAGFGGTFQIGDTITWTTNPASVPIWHERIIPAGANSFAGNKAIVVFDGESA